MHFSPKLLQKLFVLFIYYRHGKNLPDIWGYVKHKKNKNKIMMKDFLKPSIIYFKCDIKIVSSFLDWCVYSSQSLVEQTNCDTQICLPTVSMINNEISSISLLI